MMNLKTLRILLCLLLIAPAMSANPRSFKQAAKVLGDSILLKATWALSQEPVTVTAAFSARSAGGRHDFYSEGDYWWPNPADPNGPYITRDGLTNPENFVAHRKAMIRFSDIAGTLASAYLITRNDKYADQAFRHFQAWFIDTATAMNPSLLYAQAIKGKATGRGIGIIDMIQMIEVAKSIAVFEKAGKIPLQQLNAIKHWFSAYLAWLNTHPYGIDERESKNNHGTCWVMQTAVFAQLVGDTALVNYCADRFKKVLLPNQLAANGSFPLELKRTKPFGYSLFNLDAFATLAAILSTPKNDLWNYTLSDGQNLKTGVQFMYPFVKNKAAWPFPRDVMYWDDWPVAHPFLLFAFQNQPVKAWLSTWKSLNHFPQTDEVIRNLPVRNPLIWLN